MCYNFFAMSQTATNQSQSPDFSALGAELSSIAKALARFSKKLQATSVFKIVSISKKSDPDMFTKEFIETVKQSRKEIGNGDVISSHHRNKRFNK